MVRSGKPRSFLELGQVGQTLDHRHAGVVQEAVVGVVGDASHLEARTVSPQAVDAALFDHPPDGLLLDIGAIVGGGRPVQVVAPGHDQHPVAYLHIPSGLNLRQGDRLVLLFAPEIQHDCGPKERMNRDLGGVLTAGEKVKRRFDVRPHVGPHVDGVHNVALGAGTVAALGNLQGVLFLAWIEDMG